MTHGAAESQHFGSGFLFHLCALHEVTEFGFNRVQLLQKLVLTIIISLSFYQPVLLLLA